MYRVRVKRNLCLIGQDEAARSAGKGGRREAEREREKLGLLGGGTAGVRGVAEARVHWWVQCVH